MSDYYDDVNRVEQLYGYLRRLPNTQERERQQGERFLEWAKTFPDYRILLQNPGRPGTLTDPNPVFAEYLRYANQLGLRATGGRINTGIDMAKAAQAQLAEDYLNRLREAGAEIPSNVLPSAGTAYDPTKVAQSVIQATGQQRQQWRQQYLAKQQSQAENAARTWPAYEELMRGLENDPLTQLYTGEKYMETPMTREQYDYLRLQDRYANDLQSLVNYRPSQFNPNIRPPGDTYQYYKWLEQKLKSDFEQQKQEAQRQEQQALKALSMVGNRAFLTSPTTRQTLGITDEDVRRSIEAYRQETQQSGGLDRFREEARAQSARQNLFAMQSAAARGMYNAPSQAFQSPFAYRTWGLSQPAQPAATPNYAAMAQQIPSGSATATQGGQTALPMPQRPNSPTYVNPYARPVPQRPNRPTYVNPYARPVPERGVGLLKPPPVGTGMQRGGAGGLLNRLYQNV